MWGGLLPGYQPNATRFSSCENSAKIVGQTPWSARVPLDPLFATGSISSKREGRPGGRPRTGGPPHNFCRPSGHGKNERHWADSLRYLVTKPTMAAQLAQPSVPNRCQMEKRRSEEHTSELQS